MSESVAMEPMPPEVVEPLKALVRAWKAAEPVVRPWGEAQSAGPDKRQFLSVLGVAKRDMLMLEQFVVRELGRPV